MLSRVARTLSIAASCIALSACGGGADQADASQAPIEKHIAADVASTGPVAGFYKARHWTAAWKGDAAGELLAALGKASAHGLRANMFLKTPLPKDPDLRDVALTRAAINYASALARGYADPARIHEVYEIPRPGPDIAAGLGAALQQGQIQSWFESLAPQTDDYRAYSAGFLQSLQDAQQARASGSPNQRAVDRARQLAVAMERLRWLERTPPATRIDVNTANATLEYWRDGAPADRRTVVVGEPDWETPQLQSPIFRLVANPVWRVPKSIVEDELGAKGAGYLKANNMEWRDGRLVQLPGPKNALGQVKLDMRNDHAIYLHDTPAKSWFTAPERHRSHGCVRVANAVEFAAMLAAQENVVPQFEEGLEKQDETFVNLKTEIPVRLLYHTVAYENGAVQLFPDIYGWDEDVARALGLASGRSRGERKRSGDVGP